MAAIKWFEQTDKRTAGRADDGTVSLSHTYTVVCGSAEDGPIVAVDKVAEEWGYWYTPHPDYPAALLKTFDAQPRAGSPLHFDVTAKYDSKRMLARPDSPPTAALPGTPSAPSPAQSGQGPAVLRPPKFTLSKRDNMEAVWHDLSGIPIKNSAGDPMEGVEINRPIMLITVTWFSLAVTMAHVADYWETINNATWNGFPARTVKVEDFSFDDTFEVVAGASPGDPNGYGLVRECKLVLGYKRGYEDPDTSVLSGWRSRFLDAGKRELIGGKPVEIKEEKSGQPLSEPYPLNGSGVRWTPGTAFSYVTPNLLREKNFAGLII